MTRARDTIGAIAWTAVGATAVPWLLLAFARNGLPIVRNVLVQDRVLTASLALAVAAGASLLAPGRWRTRNRTLVWIVGGAGLLLALAVYFNRIFMSYALAGTRHIHSGHVFRGPFNQLRSPLYGLPAAPDAVWAWAAAALAAALVLAVVALRPLERRELPWAIAALGLGLVVTLGAAQHADWLLGWRAYYAIFALDAGHFEGTSDLFRRWVPEMHALSGFGKHYPPGLAAVSGIVREAGWETPAKLLFLALPLASLVPMRALARELGIDRGGSNAAAFLVVASSPFLMYTSLSPLPALLPLSTALLWLVARGIRKGAAGTGVAFGFGFALYTLFSFASFMLGLTMVWFALFALGQRETSADRLLRIGAVAGVTLVGCFAALALATGFDVLDCLREGMRMRRLVAGPPVVDMPDFLLRATGSPLAYTLASGIPLGVLAVAAWPGVRRDPTASPLLKAFVPAVLVGVVLASLSAPYLETERIWLFFTPLLALVAGREWSRRCRLEGRATLVGVAAICAVLACSFSLYFQPHMIRPYRGAERDCALPCPKPASLRASASLMLTVSGSLHESRTALESAR